MPTALAALQEAESEKVEDAGRWKRLLLRAAHRPLSRQLLVFAAFVTLTALMTWPWVLHLRDAVIDPGDPYMIAWSLWWDYHQTFHDPLRLFHANVFYPYQYTLAFSENDYGIALLFFPLFAAGFRPLTVHSVATFLGFAFCGYAMFRLTRTLTGSNAAAWVAGVVFAFVPFRFHLLSHLHYLFAGWIPLLLEALVLYAHKRSWRRAAWLGAAFLMNALTCISWFIMTLVPLLLTAALLVARDRALLRERAFWLRAGAALGVAALLLLPFLLPYYWVSVMYGLRWPEWEIAHNSASLMHWLAAEGRNKLWEGMGAHIAGGHRLFPGLLAPLLALAALRIGPGPRGEFASLETRRHRRLNVALDAVIVLAAVITVLALGYEDVSFRVLGVQLLSVSIHTPDHTLAIIVVLLLVRAGLALSRRGRRGLMSVPVPGVVLLDLRSLMGGSPRGPMRERRGEVLGVGLIWLAWGFLSSLGTNFFVNRLLHDYVRLFQSLRFPSRWAMICYVGLALLAGAGACALMRLAARRFPTPYAPLAVVLIISAALVFELRAFPLRFERGEVEPDALALRLKETPMRGGLVELPSEQGVERHRYMLRAADHGRPLVNATASFISPLTSEINKATRKGAPAAAFLDLLEGIPASYLVIHSAALLPDERVGYEAFLAQAVARGRLRFVNRFDGRDDLYAVVKTEPEAKSEAELPFENPLREWGAAVEEDPLHLLKHFRRWSQTVYGLYVAAFGRMPRYKEFVADVRVVGRGVIMGADEQEPQLDQNLRQLAEALTRRAEFDSAYSALSDAQYVEKLFSNAGLQLSEEERASLAGGLARGIETRAGVLLMVASDERLARREENRAQVLLHFFAYLRRNPDDPPDRNMDGFLHWVGELEKNGGEAALAVAFADSIERKEILARAR